MLVQTAHEHGLGIVLDIVPHHMAAAAENAWWWSVLELGQASPYAHHFDIDWDPPTRRLRGSVLLPVLGDHYGRVLESGELRLERGKDDALVARYYDHVAPLSPETADEIWAIAGRRGTSVDDVLAEINADRDRVDGILDRQHHRFAALAIGQPRARLPPVLRHRLARRAAQRTRRVFVDSHELVLRLVLEGAGRRAARRPRRRSARSRRLPRAAAIARAGRVDRRREDPPPGRDAAVVADRRHDGLRLPRARGRSARSTRAVLPSSKRRTATSPATSVDYAQVSMDARRQALVDSLDTDLERLVAILVRVCEHRRRWRDFTRTELRDALAEAHRPRSGAYRTYVRPGYAGHRQTTDRRLIDGALDGKLRAMFPASTPTCSICFGSCSPASLNGDDEAAFVARFQQLTGPVAAKGEEDTAFYRWTPLLSLNEVGLGTRPSVGRRRAHSMPSMRTRSERGRDDARDVDARHQAQRGRARSPDAAVGDARGRGRTRPRTGPPPNNRHREIEADAPDRQDEWFIYQTLVGAHPLGLDRAWTVIEKSLRESKRRTSWIESRRTTTSEPSAASSRRSSADDEFARELDRLRRTVGRARSSQLAHARSPCACLRQVCPTRIKAPSSGTTASSIRTIAGRSTSPLGRRCSSPSRRALQPSCGAMIGRAARRSSRWCASASGCAHDMPMHSVSMVRIDRSRSKARTLSHVVAFTRGDDGRGRRTTTRHEHVTHRRASGVAGRSLAQRPRPRSTSTAARPRSTNSAATSRSPSSNALSELRVDCGGYSHTIAPTFVRSGSGSSPWTASPGRYVDDVRLAMRASTPWLRAASSIAAPSPT